MGKRLARRETTIAIQFKRAPHPPFEEVAAESLRPNVLLIHVQPNEGISLAIGAKVPGLGMAIRNVHMDFLYGSGFREGVPEAYERLILDAMLGDATLFTRSDEIEEQWALVDAMVAPWQRDRPGVPELRRRHLGAAVGGRADSPRRPIVATALVRGLERAGLSVAEIERELARLRRSAVEGDASNMRTSVMTHCVWVPPKWLDVAEGDAQRAWPSAIRREPILLIPEPDEPNGLDADVSVRCFDAGERHICGEVIELHLRGNRAHRACLDRACRC